MKKFEADKEVWPQQVSASVAYHRASLALGGAYSVLLGKRRHQVSNWRAWFDDSNPVLARLAAAMVAAGYDKQYTENAIAKAAHDLFDDAYCIVHDC